MKKIIFNLLIGAAGMFTLLVIVAVATTTAPSSTSQPIEANAAPEPAQKAKSSAPIPLGTPAAVANDRAITVTGSEEVEALNGGEFGGTVEAKGGKLVVVYFTAENTGKESGDLTFTALTLKDSQGRTHNALSDFEEIYTASLWTTNKGLGSKSDQLFPGGTVKTAEVFRVSPDAEGLALEARGELMAIE
jgi:hypothetical protein